MATDPVGTYVLVHGAFHGGWCWSGVADRLRARGHRVFTPTQTGLGERGHLIGSRPDLSTFIEDVARVLVMEDLADVVLVGHSFGGSTISGVADRLPMRLRHLVYLDALLLRSGETPLDNLPGKVVERYRALAVETSGGLSVPPPPPAYFGITDPDQAAWLATKLTPHPFGTYLDRLQLEGPVGNGLPATYIACSQEYFASTATSRERARALPGWIYREIATGHDAMLTCPDALTEMFVEVAR